MNAIKSTLGSAKLKAQALGKTLFQKGDPAEETVVARHVSSGGYSAEGPSDFWIGSGDSGGDAVFSIIDDDEYDTNGALGGSGAFGVDQDSSITTAYFDSMSKEFENMGIDAVSKGNAAAVRESFVYGRYAALIFTSIYKLTVSLGRVWW